jgi:hypothetical protein
MATSTRRLLATLGIAVLGSGAALGVFARVRAGEGAVYTIWADRDLWRAAHVSSELPTSGPELTRGSRTPGGFFYYFLAPQLAMSRNPERLEALMVGLNVAAGLALALVAWRQLGPAAGWTAAALFAASPAQVDMLRFVAYNPNYPMLFGVGAYGVFLSMLRRREGALLPALVLLVAAAAQMHFSYILLLPGFALALRWGGVRLRRREALLGAAALLVAYLPYLAAEAARGFPLLSELFTYHPLVSKSPWVDSFQNPARIRELPTGAENLALSVFGYGPGRLWVAARWGALLPYVRSFLLVAFFVCVVETLLRRRRVQQDASSAWPWRVTEAMFVVIGAGLLLLSASNINFAPRYVLFLLPAVLLIGAASAARYWRLLTDRGGSPRSLALYGATLAVAAAYLAANTAIVNLPVPGPALTLRQWQSLIADLQERAGSSAEDLSSRAALIWEVNGELKPLSAEISPASFLFESFARPGFGPAPACTLVLLRAAAEVDPGRLSAQLATLTGLEPRGLHQEFERDGRRYYSYVLPDGNCLANLRNRYVPSAEERVALSRRGSLRRQGAIEVAAPAGSRAFVVRVDSRSPRVRPLYLLLEVATRAAGVSAVLYSNDLRGYDGISSFRIRSSALVLTGGEGGATTRVPICEPTLGGWFNLVRPPWRSEAREIPPGAYRLDLSLGDVGYLEYEAGEGPRSVRLADDFVVR